MRHVGQCMNCKKAIEIETGALTELVEIAEEQGYGTSNAMIEKMLECCEHPCFFWVVTNQRITMREIRDFLGNAKQGGGVRDCGEDSPGGER